MSNSASALFKKKSYDCYEWCNTWAEPGATNNCRLRCLDYGDQQADYLKFQDYNFSLLFPAFADHSLLNNPKLFKKVGF